MGPIHSWGGMCWESLMLCLAPFPSSVTNMSWVCNMAGEFWWGLEVNVNMLFFSEWSHSPQKQLRCLLLQEALMSFTPVWITYVAPTSTPSSQTTFSTVIHNITSRLLYACLHPWSLSSQHLWLPHTKYSDLLLIDCLNQGMKKYLFSKIT